MRKLVLALVLSLGAVATTSCGTATATTPVPVQNSPQTQVHNINKTFADSVNAAVKTAIAMRDQGKLSQAVTQQIEDWSVAASLVSDKVEMELTSSDTWAVQKQKILLALTGLQIPNPGNVESTVQVALTTVGTVLVQFQMEVQ